MLNIESKLKYGRNVEPTASVRIASLWVGQILRSVPLPSAYEDRLVTTLMTEVFDVNCTSLCVALQFQKVCNFVSGGGKVQG